MSTKGKAESYIKLRGSLSLPDAIRGKSAYEIAVMNGFDGTEKEWLAALKGDMITNAYVNANNELVIVVSGADGTSEINLGEIEVVNGGADVFISNTKPDKVNCVWFNTSGVAPAEGDQILALTDDTESGVVVEVNGVEYGVGNIKANDDAATVEYDYTLI